MPIITDTLLKAKKPPAAGRIEIKDDRCAGLEFRLTKAGAASWSLRFRDPQTGKPSRFTIGRYPDVGIAAARERGNALRKDVAAGINPVVRKYRDRHDASAKTFQGLAARYMEEHARRFKRSAHADQRCLETAHPADVGKRRYDQIERADVIEFVEAIVKKGTPVQANRVQALVSMIFSFAVDAALVKFNPCSRLRKRGAETLKTRVLSDDEIRQFWRRSVLPPVTRRVGLALRLVLLTGCRSGEVAGISHKEIPDIDVPGKASWLIPADRSKNGRAHFVPLSEPARAVIKSAIELTDDGDEYLFPSPVEARRSCQRSRADDSYAADGGQDRGRGSQDVAGRTTIAPRSQAHRRYAAVADRHTARNGIGNPQPHSAACHRQTLRSLSTRRREARRTGCLGGDVTEIVEGKSGNVVRLTVSV